MESLKTDERHKMQIGCFPKEAVTTTHPASNMDGQTSANLLHIITHAPAASPQSHLPLTVPLLQVHSPRDSHFQGVFFHPSLVASPSQSQILRRDTVVRSSLGACTHQARHARRDMRDTTEQSDMEHDIGEVSCASNTAESVGAEKHCKRVEEKGCPVLETNRTCAEEPMQRYADDSLNPSTSIANKGVKPKRKISEGPALLYPYVFAFHDAVSFISYSISYQ